MHIMPVDDTSSSSLSSSMSETSSILSSISSCCSHNAIDFDNNVNNISGGNIQVPYSLLLNQNQNNNSLDYWEFNNNSEEEEDLNQEYDDNCYYYYNSYCPDSHFDSSHQFDSEYHQYNSTNGKLIPPPPPPPPMEMDLLENNQILSSDEFNSIFESFTAVVEGHNSNNNLIIDDGCLRGVNCSNGLLDDEQLSKALGAIAMI